VGADCQILAFDVIGAMSDYLMNFRADQSLILAKLIGIYPFCMPQFTENRFKCFIGPLSDRKPDYGFVTAIQGINDLYMIFLSTHKSSDLIHFIDLSSADRRLSDTFSNSKYPAKKCRCGNSENPGGASYAQSLFCIEYNISVDACIVSIIAILILLSAIAPFTFISLDTTSLKSVFLTIPCTIFTFHPAPNLQHARS